MSPIIVYVKSDEDDGITLSKAAFEKYIAEAYEHGKSEGRVFTYPYTPISPSFPQYPITYLVTDHTICSNDITY